MGPGYKLVYLFLVHSEGNILGAARNTYNMVLKKKARLKKIIICGIVRRERLFEEKQLRVLSCANLYPGSERRKPR